MYRCLNAILSSSVNDNSGHSGSPKSPVASNTSYAPSCMLAAILTLYFFNEARNFDLVEITQRLSLNQITLPVPVELLLFLAFFLLCFLWPAACAVLIYLRYNTEVEARNIHRFSTSG